MRFHADLHVHSKYSRATSRDLDLEHLAYWAARKGIGVVATGDFTHPAWVAELKQKLVPAEPGLFRLAPEIERAVLETLPAPCRTPVRFLLEVEISTIYKKGDRTRKVHHLIYAPDFATVDRISGRLGRIGNIASDGRPILGLDSRDLLEITLESHPDAYFVPAHIWTPWFAALGSQSGFDSIAECYGDLADQIFAVETGLSSDPPMNWRLSMLDRYRLTSNSDAHSPGKLGREATTFDCALDYFAIRDALKTGAGYVGTVEFFPDEGKYHLDGHRKCGVRLTPKETLQNGGRCPVCGAAVTIGVEHRIETLADRSEAEVVPPVTAGAVSNLVPLPEVLSEITASGPASKAVEQSYNRAVATLGPELAILQSVPPEDIARAGSSLLAEAINRLRAGQVIRDPGYDGEYGVIRLFEEGELGRLTAGGLLFEVPVTRRKKAAPSSADMGSEGTSAGSIPPPLAGEGGAQRRVGAPAAKETPPVALRATPSPYRGGIETAPASHVLDGLDDAQRAAAGLVAGALLIIAGPGSGKTRALTHRIAHAILDHGIPPNACLAITFTRRAAAEMQERLATLLPEGTDEVPIHTFHSLGLTILRAHPDAAGLRPGFRIADEAERVRVLADAHGVSDVRAQRLLRSISRIKRADGVPEPELAAAAAAYQRALARHNWIDFDDLVALAVRALSEDPALATRWQARFRFVSVDEFQDVDEQQFRLLSLLAPPGANLCAIGDPNQAIYGFRGADASCFARFEARYRPTVVNLARNYRSSGTIVTAASQVIAPATASRADEPLAEIVRDMHERITIHAAATDRAEAEFVIATIEGMLGGHTFFSIDSGRAVGAGDAGLAFGDIAVLYRTEQQAAALVEAFRRSGIPFRRNTHTNLAGDPVVSALVEQLATHDGALPDALQQAAAAVAAAGTVETAAVHAALPRLLAVAATCADDRARFREAIALATDADFFDPRADRVALLTLHAAKGLEFPVVFIVGLEDGVLPLHWGEPDEAATAEERRLFYVGMTRAKDRLVLTRARKRLWRGRVRPMEPSRFLSAIESALTRHQQMEGARGKPEDRQLTLF